MPGCFWRLQWEDGAEGSCVARFGFLAFRACAYVIEHVGVDVWASEVAFDVREHTVETWVSSEWCVVYFLENMFAECCVVWKIDAWWCFASEDEVVNECETWVERRLIFELFEECGCCCACWSMLFRIRVEDWSWVGRCMCGGRRSLLLWWRVQRCCRWGNG